LSQGASPTSRLDRPGPGETIGLGAHRFSAPVSVPVLAVALAIAIFLVDTAAPLEAAVAVLYVLVVMLVSGFMSRRGLLVVTYACIALAAASHLLAHGLTLGSPLLRALISIAAIAITTFLTLRYQSASARLREQAQLLDLTHDAIFVRNIDSVITYWNRAATELYGWPAEYALGNVSHQLIRTRFPEPLEMIMAELMRIDRWEGELVHTTRDGAQVTVSSRWSLRRDCEGRPAAVLETNTDITARARAEKALQEAQANLAHATRVSTLGELTASIAHEVNQPLTAIMTSADASLRWLERDQPPIDQVRRLLTRVIENTARAGEVIKRLRALAKKADPQHTRLNLNEVVNETIPLVRRELANASVLLRLEPAVALAEIQGDRIQLQQVIINLVINAVQAMEAVADRRLLIRTLQPDADRVELEVCDSGPGIDPKQAHRLFEAFYTTKPDGMGMGLSISRSIVETHGGRISAACSAAQGAVFTITLPVAG
jgi:PAS domain S-box-containing protein